MKKYLPIAVALAALLTLAPAAGAVVYVEGTGEPAFTNTTTNTQWVRWQGSSAYESFAPRLEIDSLHFAKLHVRATLPHPRATHAREVRFPGGFQWEAAIQKVIPAVPFQKPGGVHCADEIADAECGCHKNLLGAHAVQFRNCEIGELI